MLRCSLILFGAILLVSMSFAPALATTPQQVLSLICKSRNIHGKTCSNVPSYPRDNGAPVCNVDLYGDLYEVKVDSTAVLVVPYTSDCESHATNFGGSMLVERVGAALKFRGFHRGENLGAGCMVVKKTKYQDGIYCIAASIHQGQEATSFIEYNLLQKDVHAYTINGVPHLNAENGFERVNYYSVTCSHRIEYLHLGKLGVGPAANTLAFDVSYADADMIGRACRPGAKAPADAFEPPGDGEAYLVGEKPKQDRYVFDIETGIVSPLSSYGQAALAARPDLARPATLLPISERRIALVIGNSKYAKASPLPNPTADAAAMAETLKGLGFSSVTLLQDADQRSMLQALSKFAEDANGADWALVFYAGHGIVVDGKNYLVPTDATLSSDSTVQFEALSLDQVTNATSGARKLRLVILDACRDSPFIKSMKVRSASRAITRGLARVEPSVGTMVVYAARDGAVAADGDGTHSPFTTALLHDLGQPNLELNLLFRKIRDEVLAATSNQQEPFTYGSLPGEQFFFAQTKAN